MRIAQVAPLYQRVPPAFYGGTERVVSYLTEELVRQGHHVTQFASGDSRTRAHLVSVWDKALRLDDRRPEPTSRFTAERMARDYCQVYEALRRRAWRLSS